MIQVAVKEIIVGKRYREKFEDIDLLAASIQDHGQIAPIVVDENNNLIAGERRYRAHVMLKKETIGVIYRKDLNEVQKKELEIEENIQRKAFTWQEEVVAKAQLHKLKQELYGKAVKGHGTVDTWKVKDTAEALGESVGTVSMDIQLARGMKAFPELMKEKSKTTAFKKLKNKQEEILNEELSRRLKEKGIVDHPSVIHGNCIEELSKMPAESIDLIVTDPPYGIDIGEAQTFGRQSAQKTYEDSEYATFDMLDKVIKELYRVLKMDRHMYIFFAIDKYEPLTKLLIKHGFSVSSIPLVWDKGSGSYPSQSTSFVHSYEPCLFIQKGKRKLNGTPRDIFPIKRVPPGAKIHPSEKPCELLRNFIELSSLPGETVLDAFAGSGATLVAAKECNRKAIGIELDISYYTNICKRLSGEKVEGVEE